MKQLPIESSERTSLHLKLMKVEDELKQDWYQKLKKTGEEVPNVMGRPKNMSTKQFLEDNDRKQKEKSALEAAREQSKKTREEMMAEVEEEMK